jgi:hypothetical protein
MPVTTRRKRYQVPKKKDATYQQITHDLAEKNKKTEREGAVMEM